METITITFDGNNVIVTNGEHTITSNFTKTHESQRALIALAEFYGYDPTGIFCFDEEFETDTDNKRHYPCDTEPYHCPFDAEDGEACRCYCGIGVDEDEPDYPDEDEEFYNDLLMEQREQM